MWMCMMEKVVKMGSNGRILLPATYRKALHLQEGSRVFLKLENGRLVLSSIELAAKKAQDLVKKHCAGHSLVADLKAMRDEENQHE